MKTASASHDRREHVERTHVTKDTASRPRPLALACEKARCVNNDLHAKRERETLTEIFAREKCLYHVCAANTRTCNRILERIN